MHRWRMECAERPSYSAACWTVRSLESRPEVVWLHSGLETAYHHLGDCFSQGCQRIGENFSSSAHLPVPYEKFVNIPVVELQ